MANKFKVLVDNLISEALIHQIAGGGSKVGAYEYINGDPAQGVQSVVIHRDNIPDYYDRLLDELPSNFKGKAPIGRITQDYDSPKDVTDLEGNPIKDPSVLHNPDPTVHWNDKSRRSTEQMQAMARARQEKKTLAAAARINKPVAPQDVKALHDFFNLGPDQVDDAAVAYKDSVDQFKHKFGVDQDGLKKLVAAVHTIRKTGNQTSQDSNAPAWTHTFIEKYLKKEEPTKEATKKEKAKDKEKIVPVTRTNSKGIDLPSEAELSINAANTGHGQLRYVSGSKLNKLDLDLLHNILPKLQDIDVAQISDKDPKLASRLHDGLGNNWKAIVNLAKHAKQWSRTGNPDPKEWEEALKGNPLITATHLDKLSNIKEITDAIYKMVSAPDNNPKSIKPDTHYHLPPKNGEKNGKEVEFNSEALNKVLSDLGTATPWSLLQNKAGEANLSGKAAELYKLFGPSWATVISVAQRLNKFKADGNPDPIKQAKEEYGKALEAHLGKDWEKTFSKVVNAIGPVAELTQKDQKLNKKDQELSKITAAYNNGSGDFTPDLKYLRDIAIPSTAGKDLLKNDPTLSKEMESKLGPSWFYVMSVAKKAQTAAFKGHDPYAIIFKSLEADPTMNETLKKNLGQAYDASIKSIIQATTGIKPPPSLNPPKEGKPPVVDPSIAAANDVVSAKEPETQQVASQPVAPEEPVLPAQTSEPVQEPVPQIAPVTARPEQPTAAEFQELMAKLAPKDVPNRLAAPAVPSTPIEQPQEAPAENPIQSGEPAAQEQPQEPVAQPQANEPETKTEPDLPVVEPEQKPEEPVATDQTNEPEDIAQEPAKTNADGIPITEPVVGKGDIPQPHAALINSELPPGTFPYIKDGVIVKVGPDHIKDVLKMNVTADQEKDPTVAAQLKQLLGKSWKPLKGFIDEITSDVKDGTMASPNEFKIYYKKHLSQPDQIKKMQDNFGMDWKKFLDNLVDTVYSELTKSQA